MSLPGYCADAHRGRYWYLDQAKPFSYLLYCIRPHCALKRKVDNSMISTSETTTTTRRRGPWHLRRIAQTTPLPALARIRCMGNPHPGNPALLDKPSEGTRPRSRYSSHRTWHRTSISPTADNLNSAIKIPNVSAQSDSPGQLPVRQQRQQ